MMFTKYGVLILVLILLSGCDDLLGVDGGGYDYIYDDEWRTCEEICSGLCESCWSYATDIMDCEDSCKRDCEYLGCNINSYSTECDVAFQEACLTEW